MQRNGSRSSISLGYTLIEVIATIVIAGILTAVTAPRFLDNRSLAERGYIDELSSSLRYAQRVAIASECHVSFTIDAAGYSAWLRASEAACDSGTGAFSTPILRTDGSALSGPTPSDVSLSGSGTIVFDRDGSVANGPAPLFAAGPFTLRIDRDTGAVTVTP